MYLRFVNQWIRLEHELKGGGGGGGGGGSKPGSPQPTETTTSPPGGARSGASGGASGAGGTYAHPGSSTHPHVYVTKSGDHTVTYGDTQEEEEGGSGEGRDQFWTPGFQEACILRQRQQHYIGSSPIYKTELSDNRHMPWGQAQLPVGHSARFDHPQGSSAMTTGKPPMVLYETIKENEELDLECEKWRRNRHRTLDRVVKTKREDMVRPDIKGIGRDIKNIPAKDTPKVPVKDSKKSYLDVPKTECLDDIVNGTEPGQPLQHQMIQEFIIEKAKEIDSISRADHMGLYSPRPRSKQSNQHPRRSPRIHIKHKAIPSQLKVQKDPKAPPGEIVPPLLDLWKGADLSKVRELQNKEAARANAIPPKLDLWSQYRHRVEVSKGAEPKLSHTPKSPPSGSLKQGEGKSEPLGTGSASDPYRRAATPIEKRYLPEDPLRPQDRKSHPLRQGDDAIPVYRPFAFNRRSNKNNRKCISTSSSNQSSFGKKAPSHLSGYSGHGRDSGRFSMKSEVINELQDRISDMQSRNASLKRDRTVQESGNATKAALVKRMSSVSSSGNPNQDALRQKLHEELALRCGRGRATNDADYAARLFSLHAVRPHRHSSMIDHHEKPRPTTSMERFAHTSLAIPDTSSVRALASSTSQPWRNKGLNTLEDIDSVISDDLSDLDEVSVHMAMEAEDWFDGLEQLAGLPPEQLAEGDQDELDGYRTKRVIQRNRRLNISKFHELHKQRLARRWDPSDSVCSEIIHECSDDDQESDDIIVIETAL